MKSKSSRGIPDKQEPECSLISVKQTLTADRLGLSAAGRLAVSHAACLSLGRPRRAPYSRVALALDALRAEPPSSPICP